MARRVKFIATCTLVLDCVDLERCRVSEQLLQQRGYHPRSVQERGKNCVRSLEREVDQGVLEELLEQTCRDVETAITPNVMKWKAFVQVVGPRSGWATMEAGKSVLRGTLDH